MIANRHASKCRVRIAHPTTVRILRCHSRAGGNPYGTSLRNERASLEAGYSACAQWIPSHAGMTAWPTGWPRARATIRIGQIILSVGVPGETLSMRLSKHALPRRGGLPGGLPGGLGLGPAKRNADPGNANKKCRVDQVKRIHRSSTLVDPAWHKFTSCHPRGALIHRQHDDFADGAGGSPAIGSRVIRYRKYCAGVEGEN